VSYLAAALDRLEPLDPAVFNALAAPGVSVAATVLLTALTEIPQRCSSKFPTPEPA
jgi:hypothetical protein